MQEAIVILIVALAAAYAAWRWMPGVLKRKAAGAIAGGSQRLGMTDEAGAQKLSDALSAPSGCGACAQCAPSCASKDEGQPAR
jgi:type II secretory pathway pseudopilin PulG